MNIIKNVDNVLNIEFRFLHPDTGSYYDYCCIELDDNCYLEDGNINADYIFHKLWDIYDYGHYYHELTIWVKYLLSDSLFIHEYYLTRYTCECVSRTMKKIK